MPRIPPQDVPFIDPKTGCVTLDWYDYLQSSDLNPAWTSYPLPTTSITAISGSITTKSGSVRYRKLGRLCFFSLDLTITTNGTGAGGINIAMPFTFGQATQIIAGRETVSGRMLQGVCTASSTNLQILNYDNSYPATSGSHLVLSGVAELTG